METRLAPDARLGRPDDRGMRARVHGRDAVRDPEPVSDCGGRRCREFEILDWDRLAKIAVYEEPDGKPRPLI